MTERSQDRRYRARDPTRLAPDSRDGFDRRPFVAAAPALAGMVRRSFDESPPRRERRCSPDSGLE